jgi:hypothetical protein
VSITTDVKALFDGPGGRYRVVEDPASLGFAGPLSFHDPRRVPDFWQPAGAQAVGFPCGTHTASLKMLEQPAPPRTGSEISKRDSDPLIQEKVRQASVGQAHTHVGRSVSARTQSLDITSLNFSRSQSGSQGAFSPIPPSPGALASSPNTATGQYFPGQHPHLRPNVTGRAMGGYDSGLDSVTQGLHLGIYWSGADWGTGLSSVSVSHQ